MEDRLVVTRVWGRGHRTEVGAIIKEYQADTCSVATVQYFDYDDGYKNQTSHKIVQN